MGSTPRVYTISRRRRILLHHPEDVALRVLRVDEPADAGDGHSGQDDGAAGLRCPPLVLGDVVDAHRADIRDDGLTVDRALAPHEPPVDAGLLGLAGLDEPVVDRPTPLGELPTEDG